MRIQKPFFIISSGIDIPKVDQDFMNQFKLRILSSFAKMKDGDSILLPFHPSTIYPILNGHNVNVVTRQIKINAWRFWIKYKEHKVGDTITILDCDHNAINREDKGTIIQVVDEIGYGISVKKDDKEFEIFVDKDKVI